VIRNISQAKAELSSASGRDRKTSVPPLAANTCIGGAGVFACRFHGGGVRSLIGDSENTVFYQRVSLWEMWLKVSWDKLQLPADFEERLAGEAFEALPLTAK
jgi:hypothetical protein